MKPSRKTRITLNRSTPFILSLLAKASMLCISILVFISCEEDINTVGFKPDRNRFRVRYAEIELPSSVMLSGPVITSNVGGDNQTPRLLVGSYQDNKLGKINAESYIQFRPSSPALVLPRDAEFESLVLSLSLDYYNYGSRDASTVNFTVHELTDSLITEATYFNTSIGGYNTASIGSISKTIDPVSFDDTYTKNNDSDGTNNVIDSLLIPINASYANELYQLAKSISVTANSSTGKNDTATVINYADFRKFRRIFKGFAIRSDASNKIVGFNPSYVSGGTSRSVLVLNYTYIDKVESSSTKGQRIKGKLEFSLYSGGSVSFTKISAERAGSPLQNVDQLYKPFYPDGDNRFVGSGSPVLTRFDLAKFFDYTDTIKNLIINSAEITINPDESSSFKMPDNLGFRIISTKNEFLTSSDTISTSYSGQIVTDAQGYLMLGESSLSGTSSLKTLGLTQTDNVYSYNSNFTRYLQTLYTLTDKSQRLSQYALIPLSPAIGKSVNRLIFNKNNLKLKVYFTTPSGSEK